MLVAALLMVARFGTQLSRDIRRDPLVYLCILYIVLHVALALPALNGAAAAVAGLMIDLRYIMYFLLVYLFVKYRPQYQNIFWRVAAVGAVVVFGFLLLQFVLPVDFLTHLGYGRDTIAPYILVDMNPDYVRYNSTLRGPNPLSAYALGALSLAVAWWLVRAKQATAKRRWLVLGALAISAVALWVGYSRSALLGAAAAMAFIFVVFYGRRISRRAWGAISAAALVFGFGIFLIRDTTFFHTAIMHDNPGTGAAVNSNEGHANSLIDGLALMIRQPMGAGVGSTGSPAMYGKNALIIENQYLMVAHEVGWLGLGLFCTIFGIILVKLWRIRQDWRALGLLASGVGLALVGVLLPVWADDTVSIVWWGLSALALSGNKTK